MHFVEQHFAHLAWRGEQETVARMAENFLLDLLHALGEQTSGFGQCVSVEADAMVFHAGQHWHEWHLDVFEHLGQSVLFEFGFQERHEAQRHIGILASIILD